MCMIFLSCYLPAINSQLCFLLSVECIKISVKIFVNDTLKEVIIHAWLLFIFNLKKKQQQQHRNMFCISVDESQ